MSKAMNILILVAVRLKSSRLPRKALADLAGKPLIVRLTERVMKARLPEAVYWCTSSNPEDDPLEELSRTSPAFIYRGDELDVMSRFIEVAWSRGAETLIRVTGDNPLTDPVMIDRMVAAHQAVGADYSYTEDLPRGTRCEVVSRSALETCHDLAQDPKASEYMTLMLRRPDRFRILNVDAYAAAVRRPELRLTVDYPEDLAVVRAIYEAFGGEPPSLPEIIAWLDAHPEVRDRNARLGPVELDPCVNVQLRSDI